MIIDTDIIIWYMKNNENAARLLDKNRGFYMSTITYMELIQGMRSKKELLALNAALQIWQAKILQVNEVISTRAMIYVEHLFLSHSLKVADALIGATAVIYKKPLYSGNDKHFSVIGELDFQKFVP